MQTEMRVSQADAANVQQAYYVFMAHGGVFPPKE